MSCKGHDTQNCHGCMLTFYDALDTLAVLGNKTEYQRVVSWLAEHGAATFDRDVSVSVFETNIRVLGSLISNHLLASDEKRGLVPGYDGVLLKLAIDVGLRLLQAYDTPTGLPYGSVNFKSGVRPGETPVSATATGGTCLLEFHLLSKLSGIKAFRKAADKVIFSPFSYGCDDACSFSPSLPLWPSLSLLLSIDPDPPLPREH